MMAWMTILFLVCSVSFAKEKNEINERNATGYFSQHAKGWLWYDDPIEKEEQEEGDEKEKTDEIAEQMNAIRAAVKKSLEKLYLFPTKENIKNYIKLQDKLVSRASEVQHNWQAVLLENPELDYSLKHPTNNIAKQVEYDLEKKQENAVIHDLAKKSGLFFFYRSTCVYCQRFAPIVKDFAATYGITVIPITMDGISLPEFPNSHPDQGQAKQFDVRAEPALFAVNPYTQKAFPIAYGLTSQADIKKNMVNIATRFGGDVK